MSQRRCTMYRLSPDHHEPIHEPARCCTCWRTCRNTCDPGRSWCQDCEAAAANSGDTRVLAWLDEMTAPPTSADELINDLRGA